VVEWLKRLPDILAECELRWALTIGSPFPDLTYGTYNYIAPATRADGTEIIVKAGFPDREIQTEIDALRLYGGRGSVFLVDSDGDLGVMLIERLRPGAMLASVEDDVQATSIAASVMKRLRRRVTEEEASLFPSVGDWARGLGKLRQRYSGETGPLPKMLVEQAEGLFAELLPSMGEPVLLHGDLHHYNILTAEREPWLAIDPKGVIGEAEYETGALLRNPAPYVTTWQDLDRLMARRIEQLAEELGFDRERIRGWAIAQAVLSAWWHVEDAGDSGYLSSGFGEVIALAEVLAAI
jgi:streptomycin 6-kinase